MQLHPRKSKCGCEADTTMMSAMMFVHPVLFPGRRAMQVHHYRKRDEAHFWHWSDKEVVKI